MPVPAKINSQIEIDLGKKEPPFEATPRAKAHAEGQVQRIGGDRSAHGAGTNAFSSGLSRKPFSRSAASSNGDERKRHLHLYLVQ